MSFCKVEVLLRMTYSGFVWLYAFVFFGRRGRRAFTIDNRWFSGAASSSPTGCFEIHKIRLFFCGQSGKRSGAREVNDTTV